MKVLIVKGFPFFFLVNDFFFLVNTDNLFYECFSLLMTRCFCEALIGMGSVLR